MAIDSPCIQVCILDPRSGLCRGCGRTLDEIARWTSFSDAERARVIGMLPARLIATTTTPSPTALAANSG
jgi:predicted Fe-S protein YdhL (DUF1289 family)